MSTKKGAVVRQASFLMIAGLVCRVIGLLYRSPLSAIIGDAGAGYYSYANEWYSILLLISAYSIPTAVSKVMAERLALGRYKDAQRVFKASMFYVLIVGGVTAILCYVLAPFLLNTTPEAVLALRVLAPTILLSGILGVMRGYFQAHNTMVPTSISQIAEQIINAFVSIFAAYMFTRTLIDVDAIGQFGAAGGTLGTGAGVITGLLFMVLVYGINGKGIKHRISSDKTRHRETYGEVFKVILMMVTPVIFSTCVYNVSGVIDQTIYTNISAVQGLSGETAAQAYSAYSYYCKPIINIPVAMGSAMATAIIPAVASHFALGQRGEAIDRIDECIQFTMFIAIPAAIGLGVLSYPVIFLLFPSADLSAAAMILSIGAISVVFYCLSSVTNGILQGLGKPRLPVIHAAIALAVNIVLLIILMMTGLGVTAVVLATVAYSLVVCILNARSIGQLLDYRTNVKNCYLYPAAAAAIMGVIVAVIYWVPRLLLPDLLTRYSISAVVTFVAVLIGVLAYLFIYLKISNLPDEEVKKLPMGTKILTVARKLRVR